MITSATWWFAVCVGMTEKRRYDRGKRGGRGKHKHLLVIREEGGAIWTGEGEAK